MKPFVVGIAGGTGSGKTTVADRIASAFATDVVLMDMDSYYADYKELSSKDRRKINFDHPDAFDIDLFVEHIFALKEGATIEKPVYSFAESCREERTNRVNPAPIIIVEGILVLAVKRIRELMDARIYVATDDDVRFIRRLQRDVQERGRTLESVISQYQATVRPMHLAFVEPSKRYADVVIPRGGNNDVAVRMVVSDLKLRVQAGGEEPNNDC